MDKKQRLFVIKKHKRQKAFYAKKKQNDTFIKQFYSLSKNIIKACKLADAQVQLSEEERKKLKSIRQKKK